MKKYISFLFVGISILLGACSNDETVTEQPEREKTAPQLIASVDQGDKIVTKAGVIEDNDYTVGEKIYWSNGDATTVFFTNPSTTHPLQYKRVDYAASVVAGEQSNSCTFVAQSGSVDDGAYTAYGLYPSSAWELRTDYGSFLRANVPAYQTQDQANSTHTGAYMLMKAQSDVVVNGSSPINLTYKHLASMLRFAVWNNSDNNSLKLENINVGLSSGKSVFAAIANLNNIDDGSLSVGNSSKFPNLTLELTGNARNFSVKDGKNQCEGYMAVLPTATDAFESSDDLIIELSFTDGTNNYLVTKTYNIGTDLDFLSGGIEQGNSYYFRLKVDTGDLNAMTGTSYAVGDYWPDNTYPDGIVFWVKPGSFGTKGKVVAFKEAYVSKWGPDNDEDAAGVAGIRSLTDGATATRSLIAKYKGSIVAFSMDYPAFFHIYNMNNGNENGAWYLPARDELKMLYAGYSGKVYESIVGWIASNNMPGYDSPECKEARTQFNAKLTAKDGGIAIGCSGNSVAKRYLSSSEDWANGSFIFNVESAQYGYFLKSDDGNVRWIREY
ncbi:fimbrillin family protein [Dysgonomonas sp. Marseille-P4677]|uniref:fimbrillin family protein n=1 Tax=Dysgonomonas sp. Marseille-P4677 TaxID=2364790 RepID=UPI001911B210|nr:fimbrillin family protein [Dysgonomonas sp. Marseille-P4677]MBK5720792.1 fimbrillin family protein [Dysgonomonas sp. Marseille-P4677]